MDRDKTPKPVQNTVAMRVIVMVVAFCIPLTLAIVMHGSLFGYIPGKTVGSSGEPALVKSGRSETINTTDIAQDISGYGGPVPLEIFITDGRIDSIRALPNSESPEFFSKLEAASLPEKWNGKTLDEAATMEVDAVTGATYSSRAFIENVRRGAQYAEGRRIDSSGTELSVVGMIALAVILAGAVLPFFIHKPLYRIIQQLLNVGILGFWAGTFIDYSMMIGFMAAKPHISLAFITTLVLLVVGFIYPAIGKPGHYCSWICPFGSLQELTGKVCRKKWKISPRAIKALDHFRQTLWCVLIVLLYAGWATSWIDYEIFTAFIVRSASWIVLVVGLVFVALSLFVNRPFCRFVCPTGTLLKNA